MSGSAWFETKRADGKQRESVEFFCKFLDVDCDRVAIENPVGIISGDYVKEWFPELSIKYGLPIKPTQTIQPWMFGDNHAKTTCLWLKGLIELVPQVTEEPELEWFEWVEKKTGKVKRQPMWYAEAWLSGGKDRGKIRSRTFPGIAKAMAEQWGNYITTGEIPEGGQYSLW